MVRLLKKAKAVIEQRLAQEIQKGLQPGMGSWYHGDNRDLASEDVRRKLRYLGFDTSGAIGGYLVLNFRDYRISTIHIRAKWCGLFWVSTSVFERTLENRS